MENKSKFGLTAGLMGALVYLIGGFNSIGLVILFIAIALWEENEFVKVSVKRVAVAFLGYTLLGYVLSVLYNLVHFIFGNASLFNTIYSKIDNVIDILYYVLIIYLALKALIHPVVETSILDGKAVDTVANAVSSMANTVNEKVNTKNTKKNCPSCGKEVALDATFCTSCGAKFDAEEKAE